MMKIDYLSVKIMQLVVMHVNYYIIIFINIIIIYIIINMMTQVIVL